MGRDRIAARVGEEAAVRAAALEAKGVVYESRLASLSAAQASGGDELLAARKQTSALSSQLVELQKLVHERGEEAATAKAEAKRLQAAAHPWQSS